MQTTWTNTFGKILYQQRYFQLHLLSFNSSNFSILQESDDLNGIENKSPGDSFEACNVNGVNKCESNYYLDLRRLQGQLI